METELRPIQRYYEPSNSPNRLFESVFPDPFPPPADNSRKTRDSRTRGAGAPEPPAENSQNARRNRLDPNFVPTSADIDEFLDQEKADYGFNRKDLERIAELALTAGRTRKQQFVDYLHTRFDDVSNLSDDGSTSKIRKSDLKLYSEVLLHRERHPGANVDVSALKKLHYDNEINNSILPPLGFMAGALAAPPIRNQLMRIPQLDSHITVLKAANPRAAAMALASLTGMTFVATAFGGKEGGNLLNNRLNSGSVHTHFYDHAAPAMQRLIKN